MSAEPILELREVVKVYGSGPSAVEALRGVDLRVEPGEFVAVTGASGSGKSTLMNLVGCLDRPTRGICRIDGRDTAGLSADQQAALRNGAIGFVFQSFQLLPRTSALENVELPLIYAGGLSARERRERAREVLQRVGLGDRLHHTPAELSGGQQQRVAIARALVTRPRLLLADEPTGNLDTATQVEILDLLASLHAQGLTVMIITHEPDVAARFHRRVAMRDGLIVEDVVEAAQQKKGDILLFPPETPPPPEGSPGKSRMSPFVQVSTVLPMALRAIFRHPLRSALTTLGIVIGVGAVVGMMAMGRSARFAIQAQIQSLGTHLLNVRSGSVGRGGVRWGVGSMTNLSLEDAEALALECPSLAMVSPQVRTSGQVKAGAANWSTSVEGVGEDYLAIRAWEVVSGNPMLASDIRQGVKVCLVGQTVVDELFGGNDPVGEVLRINRVPFRVVGVLKERGESGWGQDQDDVILAPFTAVQRRLMGITHINAILASAVSDEAVETAEQEITSLLRARHKIGPQDDDDFVVRTQTEMTQAAGGMLGTMTLLLAGIAGVSLLVGGIGIMNIMLVSVTERTREIGIRLAVGARRRDVLVQFLAEAVALSAAGGLLGVGLGAGIDGVVRSMAGWPTGITPGAVGLAVGFSAAVGVFFGFYPALTAARLDPIHCLRHE